LSRDVAKGASSQLEKKAAKKLAKRWAWFRRKMHIIITDRDGILNCNNTNLFSLLDKVFKEFQKFFPGLMVIHCSSHMLKNFLQKLDRADNHLKKGHGLKSK
jgi:hypothetical protein